MNYNALQAAMLNGTAAQVVPQWVVRLLEGVVQGRTAVAMTRHPLGFSCIPVERTGERGVCVHVWSDSLPQAGPTTSTVHAHSWDLVSYVLYGTLRNEVIGVRDARNQPAHRLFEIRSDAGADEVRGTSRLVHYEITTTGVHHPGEVYSLPAGVFHRTTVGPDTATVALGSGRPGIVDLALGGIDTTSHHVRRRRCDRDEIARAARVVIEQLAAVPEPPHQEEPCTCRKP